MSNVNASASPSPLFAPHDQIIITIHNNPDPRKQSRVDLGMSRPLPALHVARVLLQVASQLLSGVRSLPEPVKVPAEENVMVGHG